MSQSSESGDCKKNDASSPVHPMFSSEDADIILSSRDNTHFRVRSQLLRATSGWFDTLLSLPNNAPDATAVDILRLDETANILDALLRMVSGFEIPELRPIEFCEAILYAAEKYEMPGPISIVRIALCSTLLDVSPIRVYGIAARRNWVPEAQAASTRTLSLDLFHADAVPELNRLDGPIMVKLLLLHHSRRQAFKEALDDVKDFYASAGSTTCSGCAHRVDHVNWALCKYKWLTDGPVAFDTDGEELRRALESTCLHCGKPIYVASITTTKLKEIIEGLPRSVDVSSSVCTRSLSCTLRTDGATVQLHNTEYGTAQRGFIVPA